MGRSRRTLVLAVVAAAVNASVGTAAVAVRRTASPSARVVAPRCVETPYDGYQAKACVLHRQATPVNGEYRAIALLEVFFGRGTYAVLPHAGSRVAAEQRTYPKWRSTHVGVSQGAGVTFDLERTYDAGVTAGIGQSSSDNYKSTSVGGGAGVEFPYMDSVATVGVSVAQLNEGRGCQVMLYDSVWVEGYGHDGSTPVAPCVVEAPEIPQVPIP